MTTWVRGAGMSLLLFAVTVAAPGYAIAQSPEPLLLPPVPDAKAIAACRSGNGPCAVLYETTENLRMKALRGGHRIATSSLLGFAVRGTPLCPEGLMPATNALPEYCVLNVTGSDNISLSTGLGQFRGSVTVVVQETNAERVPTPDSPELVVARGRFTGDMNFAPAILDSVPLGTVVGRVSLDGFGGPAPFTGVFRLPFSLGLPGSNGYLLNSPNAVPVDMDDWVIGQVAKNETAIGYPTVRFEISF
jgi:hypothetical protein